MARSAPGQAWSIGTRRSTCRFDSIRDLRAAHSGETAAFYASLKANTLVSPLRVTPPAPRFPGGRESASRPPHIFLFVIDSLRRDYVSPYNPAVTFTPAIGQFAADSFVFERAMTRYAGTALAVPSIWAGSMLIHMLDQRPFDSRNALLALLDADGYRRVMSVDHIMRELLPPGSASVELDRGVAPMDCDFCRTMRELEARLAEASDDPRACVFVHAAAERAHRRRLEANGAGGPRVPRLLRAGRGKRAAGGRMLRRVPRLSAAVEACTTRAS